MNARDIIEAEDPKKFLKKNPQGGLGYRQRPVNRAVDLGFNFYFGSPVVMSFNIVAKDMNEAVMLANAHLDRLVGGMSVELNDELDTQFFIGEHFKNFRLTSKNCMMWWALDGEEDPDMNPDFEG